MKDVPERASRSVMLTPAVAIDGAIKTTCNVPGIQGLKSFLTEPTA